MKTIILTINDEKFVQMEINGILLPYLIGSKGSIWSTRSGRYLKPQKMSNGYLTIGLSSSLYHGTQYIHRLVAKHFIENNDPKLICINHKDGDKYNNNYENLEWCTHADNTIHMYKNKLRPEIKGKMNNQPFYLIKADEQILMQSLHKGAAFLNCSVSAIYNTLHGRQNFVKGYQVKYAH